MSIGSEGEAQECCKGGVRSPSRYGAFHTAFPECRRKNDNVQNRLNTETSTFSKMIALRRETDTIVFLVENKNFDVVYFPTGKAGQPTMWDYEKSGIIGKVSSRRVDW